jgi:hypothetical protein
MNTEKAAYWIALGVLALGVNSEYRQGNFVALHRVAERAGSVLCRAATRAEQTLAVARLLTSRDGLRADTRLASADTREMAWDRAELVREQALEQAELLRDRVRDEMVARADVMRTRAEVRRAEMEQIRLRARSQYRLTRTVNPRVSADCPEIGVRVVVNDGAEPADASMDVEVDDNLQ